MNPYILGSGVAAAGCTSYLSTTSDTAFLQQGKVGYRYVGQADYVPSGNHTICQIDFYIHSIQGDVSGVTYNAYIFTKDGVNLDTEVGKSSDKVGLTTGKNTFTFSTKPTLTNGTTYAIVLGSGTESDTNYVEMAVTSGGNTFGVRVSIYTSLKAESTYYETNSMAMTLYE